LNQQRYYSIAKRFFFKLELTSCDKKSLKIPKGAITYIMKFCATSFSTPSGHVILTENTNNQLQSALIIL